MGSAAWSVRDVLAVVYIAICIFFAWFMSLNNDIFDKHFPDREYALKQVPHDKLPLGGDFIRGVEASYWGPRWMFFAPHVCSAIVWWNLSWLQLIKSIRAKHLWFHRWNGRLQVLAMMGQIITGTGLALHSPTPGIRMMSISYGIVMTYVLAQTVYHILRKDIVRHKYWATKLFGYAQAIALQRIYFFTFMVTTVAGLPSLYKPPGELETSQQGDAEMKCMFNDSFSLCIFTAIVLTEWYQAPDHNELLEYRVKEVKSQKALQKPLMT